MIGSCPLSPTLSFVFVNTTSTSRPRSVPATGTDTSTSPMVWVQRYGSCDCSSASFALSSWSARSRSDGVGEDVMMRGEYGLRSVRRRATGVEEVDGGDVFCRGCCGKAIEKKCGVGDDKLLSLIPTDSARDAPCARCSPDFLHVQLEPKKIQKIPYVNDWVCQDLTEEFSLQHQAQYCATHPLNRERGAESRKRIRMLQAVGETLITSASPSSTQASS